MREKEHQSIEWKVLWKDEYLKWICGYANAQGGILYIGTDDDGNVVGIDNARDLLEIIPNKITDTTGINTAIQRESCKKRKTHEGRSKC